jgi:phenylpropionate dioxygenase-like ring-hydroxylating dioxygenase large terminal subunit
MSVDPASLLGSGWVDGSVYTDESIFKTEIERIFRRTWLYVAHESEVPTPGDYQRRDLAGEPVIVVRDRDENVRVLMNRCRHRGNLVCQHSAGNAQFFRCQFHGWTYSNRGDLVGVPYPQSYGQDFDRSELGLASMPVVDSYRGFIFASFTAEVPPLLEHLGEATRLIDIFVDQSPVGAVRVSAGVQRGEYRGNWKFVGMDGYHTNFVHKSVEMLQHANWRAGAKVEDESEHENGDLGPLEFGKSPDKLGNTAQDLGRGHVHINNSPQRLAKADATMASLASTPAGKEYIAAMEGQYGVGRSRTLLCAPDPHLGIFPNLQIIGVLIRVIEPISAGRTVVAQYPAMLEGVPDEINVERLRKHEWFFSPAGFGSPDDYEVFERNQAGLAADVEPRVLLTRGLGTEVTRPDGIVESSYTDEVPQRGQLARWAELMGAESGGMT